MTPAEKSREALRRYRDSADLGQYTDHEEITQTELHVHIPPPPKLPSGTDPHSSFGKFKSALVALGTAVGTGAVIALAQHCGK